MSVYVDALHRYPSRSWRFGASCHMVADSLEELHAMAQAIGLKRSWFQPAPPASIDHYDLATSRRAQAVRLGAIEIDRYQLVALVRKQRAARNTQPAVQEAAERP